MKVIVEFEQFLEHYKVVGLAVGFIMGVASTDLIKSFVDNILMPIILPFISAHGLEGATLSFWKITIAYGLFISAFIKFLLLAIVVFFVSKLVLKEKKKEESA